MARIARVRRALRSRKHELVFGYTSGLDLIGHVTYSRPALQQRAYEELDEFVGELRDDLNEQDELVLVSDHGLQDGLHTDEATVASTDPTIIESVSSVLDIRGILECELDQRDHNPVSRDCAESIGDSTSVQEQLEDLGYI